MAWARIVRAGQRVIPYGGEEMRTRSAEAAQGCCLETAELLSLSHQEWGRGLSLCGWSAAVPEKLQPYHFGNTGGERTKSRKAIPMPEAEQGESSAARVIDRKLIERAI